jgi:ribosomal protein L7/L12
MAICEVVRRGPPPSLTSIVGSTTRTLLKSIFKKLFGGGKADDRNKPPQASMSEEVQRLARNPAQKIEAIKLHREQTGLGLAEAKADIEDFIKTVQ